MACQIAAFEVANVYRPACFCQAPGQHLTTVDLGYAMAEMTGSTNREETGTLDRNTLPKLIYRFYLKRFTGHLDIVVEGSESQVWFLGGAPVGVRTGFRYAEIGRMLIEKKKLSEEFLGAIKGEAKQSGIPLGEFLVKRGAIKRQELDRILIEQILRRLGKLSTFIGSRWGLVGNLDGKMPEFTHALNPFLVVYFIFRYYNTPEEFAKLELNVKGRLLRPSTSLSFLVPAMDLAPHLLEVVKKLDKPLMLDELKRMGNIDQREALSLVQLLTAVEGIEISDVKINRKNEDEIADDIFDTFASTRTVDTQVNKTIASSARGTDPGFRSKTAGDSRDGQLDVSDKELADLFKEFDPAEIFVRRASEYPPLSTERIMSQKDISREEAEFVQQLKIMYERVKKMNPLEILGVSMSTGDAVLQRAYIEKIAVFHPDRVRTGRLKELRPHLEIIHSAIEDARKILVTPELKSAFTKVYEDPVLKGNMRQYERLRNSQPFYTKGKRLFLGKNYLSAARELAKGLREFSDHAESLVLYAWAVINLVTDKKRVAEQVLTAISYAVELEPKNFQVRNIAGKINRKLGRFREAEENMTAALQISPTSEEIKRELKTIKALKAGF